MAHWIFTEEHHMFRKSVRKFFEKELEPNVVAWESAGEVPFSFFRKLAEMGYIGIRFPEEYGGNNADLVTEAVFLEELGKYGTGGVAAAVSHHLMSLTLLALYGSEDQKKDALAAAIRGEKMAAFALNELQPGTNRLKNSEVKATWHGEYFLLNGAKKFVINGATADFICMTASTDETTGLEGTSLFLVDRESPGLSLDRNIKKLGWRASETADISFRDVQVAKSALIGEVNQANEIVQNVVQWFHVVHAILSLSLGEKSLQDAIQYSKERKQFGKTLNQFQVLQHKMAEMAVEIEKSRNLTYRALYLLNEGQDAEMEAAMAKAYAGEMVKQVADAAVQIHGGMGYMMETPVQRYWRDARALSIIGGTTEALHDVISQCLETKMTSKKAEYAKPVH